MKKTKLAPAAFLLAAACASAAAQTPPAAEAPAAAPRRPAVGVAPAAPKSFKNFPDEIFDRELKGLDGRSIFLSAFRGQVLVVNLWATWCGPCRFEIPELNKVHDEYAARGVVFVGLTVEEPEADAKKVREFVDEFGMRYAIGWADSETARTLFDGRTNIPQTFVVGPDGRVVFRSIGFSPAKSPALLREALDRALGDKQ